MRRALFFLASLSLLLALVIGVLLVRVRPRATVLPGGARVEFLGSALGEAQFTTEKSWHKTARTLLPASMTRWIPAATSGSCSRGSNSVTFYFRVTDPVGRASGVNPWSGYSTEDETGFHFNRDGGSCSFGGGPQAMYGLIFEAYPRRQSAFLVHFHDTDGAVIGSLEVPNPVHGLFPQWRPQALPQTRTVGPVTLMLRSMQESGSDRWRYVAPKWKLTSDDPAWAGAKARFTKFSDATGNQGARLSPREPAWQARTLVFRERAEDFSAAERFVITNLAVPAAGNFVAVDQSAERLGVKFTALVLAGAGEFYVTNGMYRGMSSRVASSRSTWSQGTNRVESWASPQPFLLMEAKNVQPDDEIVGTLHDDQGREIKMSDSDGYDVLPNGGRLYKRSFAPPSDDTKSLTLELRVNRPLVFEFMVNPADVQPANPPPTNQ